MTDDYRDPIFIKPSDSTTPAYIFVFDSGEHLERGPTTTVFDDNSKFEEYISNTPKTGTRIISLCSKNTVRPLRISEDAFNKLRKEYALGDELADLANSFGYKPLDEESGYGGMTVSEKEKGIHDMAYLFSYPEDYKIEGQVSWTMRQVAVFHRYDPSGRENLWIFLHTSFNAKAQQQIEAYVSDYQPHCSSATTWEALHSAVLSAYLDNWRPYLHFLGEKVEAQVRKALTSDPVETPDYWTEAMHENLLHLHYLGDKLLPITARLQATISTVTKLEMLSREFHAAQSDTNTQTSTGFIELANDAAYRKARLEGLISGGEILGKKVKDVLNMMEVGLSLRMNNKMLKLNGQMYKLGTQNFSDNATVKVVTMVTLTYLPASFIASFLGMNLFSFGGIPHGESGFMVSNQIWVFFLLTVPLTLFTLGTWHFFTQKEKRHFTPQKQGSDSFDESQEIRLHDL